MTFREKIAIDRPDVIEPKTRGGVKGCPHTYYLANRPDYCHPGSSDEGSCNRCWDREVPEIEPSRPPIDYAAEYERIKRMYEELYDKYGDMEECAKSWENEAECRGETNYELRIKNDKLKAIIRTVEVLTGGKILDE